MININKLVLFTSLLIATIAAGFSVYGIGLLFSGAAIAAMVMAGALELGKLVTTSWLFQNWNLANKLMKSYMLFAIIILMGITSLGIFGYLTSAYQKSALENNLRLSKISTYETQKLNENKNIENFKTETEKLYQLRSIQETRLTDTLNNNLITRNPIQLQTIQGQINSQIEDINENIKKIANDVDVSKSNLITIDEEIIKLKIEGSEQKDIVTFKFVAEEFDTGMNSVAKWFIFLIIAVFDPLAVVLLIAANLSLGNIGSIKKKELVEVQKKILVNDDDINKPSTSTIDINENKDESDSSKEIVAKSIENESFSNDNDKVETVVEKIVEKPVEVEKIVEKPVEVEKIVEKPVEVEKIVEKPVEVEKIVEKTVEIEKIVEKPVEIIKKQKGQRGMFSF
jgi:hypothetical protein